MWNYDDLWNFKDSLVAPACTGFFGTLTANVLEVGWQFYVWVYGVWETFCCFQEPCMTDCHMVAVDGKGCDDSRHRKKHYICIIICVDFGFGRKHSAKSTWSCFMWSLGILDFDGKTCGGWVDTKTCLCLFSGTSQGDKLMYYNISYKRT